jgi:hypothetical protein
MGHYRFIKEDSIRHSRTLVQSKIDKLKPLNYNKFKWWRNYTDNVTPLGKRAMLKDRIINGDFEPSSYIWQAQLALYVAKDKLDLRKDDHQSQVEKLQVDFARYQKLMIDYEAEETERYNSLIEAFTSAFQLTREQLEDEFLKWPDDILSFYEYADMFIRKTPAEYRKISRDMRSKKHKI